VFATNATEQAKTSNTTNAPWLAPEKGGMEHTQTTETSLGETKSYAPTITVVPMNHETIPITNITSHPQNVRQGDIGSVIESLKAHGQYRPIVVQKSTGHILAGNHTWQAAKKLKMKTIAVTWLDVDDDEALRILLVDNRTNDLASYDDHGLADLLTGLMKTEGKLSGTGFDPDDLDSLLRALELPPLPDTPDEPEKPSRSPLRCPECGFEWHEGKDGFEPV